MPGLPPTRRGRPALLRLPSHDLRALRRDAPQGLFGCWGRIQGKWLLQDRQSRRRENVHPGDGDYHSGGDVHDRAEFDTGRYDGFDARKHFDDDVGLSP